MPFGDIKLPARVGEPTFQVWDPIVSRVQMPCDACGKPCYMALDGRTLLDPGRVRPRKDKGHEAQRHEYHCRGIRRR